MAVVDALTRHFDFDLGDVSADVLGSRRLAGHAGLALAPRAWLGPGECELVDLRSGATIEAIELVPNPLWEQQGLAVVRYDAPETTAESPLVPRFRTALVTAEVDAIRAAVEWCQRFLASRKVGGQTLATHPVVAQEVAQLASDVLLLARADAAASVATRAGREWLAEQVDVIGRRLIALAGGRALLAGQMVQLRALFLTLNRLHLEG
jgi:hypothetical protein